MDNLDSLHGKSSAHVTTSTLRLLTATEQWSVRLTGEAGHVVDKLLFDPNPIPTLNSPNLMYIVA